mmetsp:Transcript_24754/g.52307  ORF Transcript_24754/g.52307 Transcript_24754/m.52307 type:complete len:896 (-) Transcript_24754:1301-3988(-)
MSTKGGQKSGAEAKASNNNINGGGKSTAPTNAWAVPFNSKSKRTANTGPPPGMGLAKSSSAAASQSQSSYVSSSVLLQHRERLLHLSLTLVGQKVILQQTNGAIVEGIFHTFTPFSSLPAEQRNKFVLKEILIRQQPKTGTEMKDGITLIVPSSKVVCLHAKDIASNITSSRNTNGASNGIGPNGAFVTDTQISGNASGRTQELVAAGNAWTAGGNSNGHANYRNQGLGGNGGGGGMMKATNSRAAALAGDGKGNNAANNQQESGAAASATSGNMSGSIGQWDQFKANKELFNVNASFDENLYTTQLDTSQIGAKKRAEAERIAHEIENTKTANIHMAEERGFKVETDFDEEDLYSGVLTKDGKQRHEKVKITKKTSDDEEKKYSNNPSKANTSSTSAAPKKIMNYAAAAAKADATKNKTAPPGFSDTAATTAPISTTKDNENKNEQDEDSPKPVVTPEKKAKEEVKTAQKNKPTKEENVPAKKVEGKAETSNTAEKDNKTSKDTSSTVTKPVGDEKVENTEETKEKETKDEQKDTKKSSKLNANAKKFTFNPSAKAFSPSFGTGGGVTTNNPAPQHPPQHTTADPGMQMYTGGHPMQPAHYIQPMGQPGMMPMMNPQFPGMRYPPSYGMEQHMSQMQHQAPHVQAQAPPSISSAPSSGNAPTPTPGSGSNTGNSNTNDDDPARPPREGEDTSQSQTQTNGQQQPPQRPQQQQPDQPVQPQGPPQQMPMGYAPSAYFPGMGMPQQRPGYAPFVPGPQQIAGRPGVSPYMYSIQPGGIPPNMPMRGPNNGPYYAGPNGHIPYHPPGGHMGYMMEDGGRGRGGRNSNGGRGGRGRGGRTGRGGRGRSNYNNANHNHNANGNVGKHTQQQYNHHQSQQQAPPQQQQSQSGNDSANKTD